MLRKDKDQDNASLPENYQKIKNFICVGIKTSHSLLKAIFKKKKKSNLNLEINSVIKF